MNTLKNGKKKDITDELPFNDLIEYVAGKIYATRLTGRWRTNKTGISMNFSGTRDFPYGEVFNFKHVFRPRAGFIDTTGVVALKEYEGRELEKVTLILDYSPSMYVGKKIARLKYMAGLVAFSSLRCKDKTTAFVFNGEQVKRYSNRLVSAYQQFYDELGEVDFYSDSKPAVNFAQVVDDIWALKKRGGVVFIISDFTQLDEWLPILETFVPTRQVHPIIVSVPADYEQLNELKSFVPFTSAYVRRVDVKPGVKYSAKFILNFLSKKSRQKNFEQAEARRRYVRDTLTKICGHEPLDFTRETRAEDITEYFTKYRWSSR